MCAVTYRSRCGGRTLVPPHYDVIRLDLVRLYSLLKERTKLRAERTNHAGVHPLLSVTSGHPSIPFIFNVFNENSQIETLMFV